MKKTLTTICVVGIAFCSLSAFAEHVGVVDMQKIFRTSSEVKQINASLKSQFSGRRTAIMKLGKVLQADMKRYQKNQSIMDKSSLVTLQKKITAEGAKLRQMQAKFQRDVMTVQNKKMSAFLKRVKSAVKAVATQQKMDLVLPSSAVLYIKNQLNVTSRVMSDLK